MTQPIIHTELYARDHAQLAAWYQQMFGWESQNQPDMDYSSGWWKESGWGFNDAKNGVKPGEVVPYIATDNIESDVQRLAENGATVDAILPVPGVGRIAHFRDPDGNHMALIQPVMPGTEAALQADESPTNTYGAVPRWHCPIFLPFTALRCVLIPAGFRTLAV